MAIEEFQIILIALITAVTCTIPGVFLVLRRMSLMSDAISHSILLGIVIAFFYVEDLSSPWLILGAVITGLLTAGISEILKKYTKIKEDSSVSMVFPAMFSVGVILINLYAKNVHIDIDAVLVGELVLAPFNTLTVGGVNIGPKSLYVMVSILLINVLFFTLFYKEMKLSTFDPELATTFGLFPILINYMFMAIVSLTAVGSFDSVGSILVVALMIAPPCAAFLLTNNLFKMLLISIGIGILSSLLGFAAAKYFDSTVSGCMATATGFCFLLVILFAPKRGLIALYRYRISQKYEFARRVLIVHISNHAGTYGEDVECTEAHLSQHIHWEKGFAKKVIAGAHKLNLISYKNGILRLTSSGFKQASLIMEQ